MSARAGREEHYAQIADAVYDVTQGAITIDGYDIRELPLTFLRSQIGLVQQEPFLFNGTVRENILYGDLLAGQDEVEAAAKVARAHDFIMALPDGYDTWIGERGVKLSVGQRQRVSIARVILKDPPIVMFDEATSNIDTETEVKIRGGAGRSHERTDDDHHCPSPLHHPWRRSNHCRGPRTCRRRRDALRH